MLWLGTQHVPPYKKKSFSSKLKKGEAWKNFWKKMKDALSPKYKSKVFTLIAQTIQKHASRSKGSIKLSKFVNKTYVLASIVIFEDWMHYMIKLLENKKQDLNPKPLYSKSTMLTN